MPSPSFEARSITTSTGTVWPCAVRAPSSNDADRTWSSRLDLSERKLPASTDTTTVEAATGSATSSSLEAIVNVAFTAPRPNIWRPEYVTVERWGSTRYLPAAGTASDGASPTAITASLRLVLPAKLLDGAPRLIERAGKSSLVQRSPAMSSGASAPYSPALVWHLRPRLCPGPQPAQISVGRRTMIRTPGTPGARAAMSSGSEDTTTAASLADAHVVAVCAASASLPRPAA